MLCGTGSKSRVAPTRTRTGTARHHAANTRIPSLPVLSLHPPPPPPITLPGSLCPSLFSCSFSPKDSFAFVCRQRRARHATAAKASTDLCSGVSRRPTADSTPDKVR